jgi:hypothetical protein
VTRIILKGANNGTIKLALKRHLDEAAECERYFVKLVTLDELAGKIHDNRGLQKER